MVGLRPHLKKGGIIIIDDAYVDDSSAFSHPLMLRYSDLVAQLRQAGVMLVDEDRVGESEAISDEHDKDFNSIQQRCKELMEKYPQNAQLFQDYIENQRKEYEILEDEVICSTMVVAELPE